MKNKILYTLVAISVMGIVILSCKKKEPESISPSYGTTGNPNYGQTTTGTPTYTNPATDPSSINDIGKEGWSNPTCVTNNSLSLKAYKGVVDITLTFPSTIKSGDYTISQKGEAGTCALTILNAPNQPSGITWYGQSGLVKIVTSSLNISATFNGVVCTQQSFNYPTVTAGGTLSCN